MHTTHINSNACTIANDKILKSTFTSETAHKNFLFCVCVHWCIQEASSFKNILVKFILSSHLRRYRKNSEAILFPLCISQRGDQNPRALLRHQSIKWKLLTLGIRQCPCQHMPSVYVNPSGLWSSVYACHSILLLVPTAKLPQLCQLSPNSSSSSQQVKLSPYCSHFVLGFRTISGSFIQTQPDNLWEPVQNKNA